MLAASPTGEDEFCNTDKLFDSRNGTPEPVVDFEAGDAFYHDDFLQVAQDVGVIPAIQFQGQDCPNAAEPDSGKADIAGPEDPAPSSGVPVRKVEGRRFLNFRVIDETNISEVNMGSKARLSVFRFPSIPQEERENFMKGVVHRIAMAREMMIGGMGFVVKRATYFGDEANFWIALVARDSLLFSKWSDVFKGLGALSFRIYHLVSEVRGPMRESLHGVVDMFEGLTTLTEVIANALDYNKDASSIPPCAGRKPRAKRTPESARKFGLSATISPPRKRSRSVMSPQDPTPSSSSSKAHGRRAHARKRRHKESDASQSSSPSTPAKRLRGAAAVRAKLDTRYTPQVDRATLSPSEASGGRTPGRAASSRGKARRCLSTEDSHDAARGHSFVSTLPAPHDHPDCERALIQSCVSFLEADNLDGAKAHMDFLLDYLGTLSVRENRLGHFLLRGNIHRLYARSLHLKDLFFHILDSHYGIQVQTLSPRSIAQDPKFCELDPESQQLLSDIAGSSESLSRTSTFLFIDMVSILVFISIYVLGQAREKALVSGSLKEDFLSMHEPAIAEVLVSHMLYCLACSIIPVTLNSAGGFGQQVQVLGRAVFLLNKFIHLHVGRVSIPDSAIQTLLFPVETSEQAILNHFLDNAFRITVKPGLERVRKTYRLNRFESLVAEVVQAYMQGKDMGVAFNIWRTIQANKKFFDRLRCTDDSYRLLPATEYSNDPSTHSIDIKDIAWLAEAMALPDL